MPKRTSRDKSNKNMFFKRTLKDTPQLFHDIAGFDMNLQEWERLCRKAWETNMNFYK